MGNCPLIIFQFKFSLYTDYKWPIVKLNFKWPMFFSMYLQNMVCLDQRFDQQDFRLGLLGLQYAPLCAALVYVYLYVFRFMLGVRPLLRPMCEWWANIIIFALRFSIEYMRNACHTPMNIYRGAVKLYVGMYIWIRNNLLNRIWG